MNICKPRTGRKLLLYLYLSVFSAVGLGLAGYLIFNYFAQTVVDAGEIIQLIVLVLVLTLSRSLTLPTRKGEQGIDISMIIIYAALILKGIYITVFIIAVSSFFTIIRWDNKNIGHIFNTPVSRTLFNNSNHVISVCLGWLVLCWVGGIPFDKVPDPYNVLGILLPSILFFFVTISVNSVNMFTVLKITSNIRYFPSLISGVSSMLPTMLAFAPIGYFFALIFKIQNGSYMALLFFIPLLFARFAFKLYLDSKEQYLRTISTLTAAIEAKDEYTEGHSKRVAEYAEGVAHAMGLRSTRIENIKVASVLHDIGKIGIDDKILRKPSKLTKAEWSKIEEHPAIGLKILEDVTMPEAVKEMIYYHHVRYDRGDIQRSGTVRGYPWKSTS